MYFVGHLLVIYVKTYFNNLVKYCDWFKYGIYQKRNKGKEQLSFHRSTILQVW